MCHPAFLAPLGIGGAGAATAAGATAAAATSGFATIGTALQVVGATVGLIGTLSQGANIQAATQEQAGQIEVQKETEAQLNSIEEQRLRQQFRQEIARQRGQMVSRGVSLDSPTAVLLGQNAARELTFEAQSVRQSGLATHHELTAQQRALRARGSNSLRTSRISAAGDLLTTAPKIWPELLK
ncbi:MAG: hypothetical protein AAF408_00090 [Pseudomonadota bacterium]